MKKLVFLTGAGMSAESGLRTFRDMGGLWEQYDIMEVASLQGWESNKELVLNFYNERRKQLLESKPNLGHFALVDFEKYFNVYIITQNVDDLHERGGSSNILHLHGELLKARSTVDESLVYDIKGWELNIGDKCEKGSQLRPHIVWFGEEVPAIADAIKLVDQADIFVIIGTSLNVYPAAGLVNYVKDNIPIYVIDPNEVIISHKNITYIREIASKGIMILKELLIEKS